MHVCSDDNSTDTQLPLLVTASVDAIHLRRRLDLHKDVQISGQVVWTGKSAMDIRMQLTQVYLQLSLIPPESLHLAPLCCYHQTLPFVSVATVQ